MINRKQYSDHVLILFKEICKHYNAGQYKNCKSSSPSFFFLFEKRKKRCPYFKIEISWVVRAFYTHLFHTNKLTDPEQLSAVHRNIRPGRESNPRHATPKPIAKHLYQTAMNWNIQTVLRIYSVISSTGDNLAGINVFIYVAILP